MFISKRKLQSLEHSIDELEKEIRRLRSFLCLPYLSFSESRDTHYGVSVEDLYQDFLERNEKVNMPSKKWQRKAQF